MLLDVGVHVPAGVAREMLAALTYAFQHAGKRPSEALRSVLADLERAAAVSQGNANRSPDRSPGGHPEDNGADWVSTTEAAARLGVSPRAIRARVQRKTISARRERGKWKVRL